ncbi:hypothetical protein BDZ91DRAFT_752248 [Kalaharituber pfeilii]|nr:hypothetical protein BDZ91DRAFT_752248 [Kalaharituber pfeilii]
MQLSTVAVITALLFSSAANAWSGYCYECSTGKDLSDFTYSCCPGEIATNEIYHCWNFPASKKATFSNCCKRYGKCAKLY